MVAQVHNLAGSDREHREQLAVELHFASESGAVCAELLTVRLGNRLSRVQ